MSAETTLYNVYRVQLSQGTGPDHEGVALVPAQLSFQGAGRFYHVKGLVGLGMDYEQKPAERFRDLQAFKAQTYIYQIKKESLPQWEAIAQGLEVPHDQRALTERNPDPPARNCSAWVDELLQNAHHLAV